MRRQYVIIIGLAVLLAAAVILVLVMQQNKSESVDTTEAIPRGTTEENPDLTVNTSTPRELTEEEKQRVEIQSIATIFAESYGTYTGTLSGSGLSSLQSITTATFYSSIQKNPPATEADTEITTQVVKAEIVTFTQSGSSVVSVPTLREQVKGEDSNVVSQELILDVVYEGGEWKVRGAQWKEATDADLISEL